MNKDGVRSVHELYTLYMRVRLLDCRLVIHIRSCPARNQLVMLIVSVPNCNTFAAMMLFKAVKSVTGTRNVGPERRYPTEQW